MINNTQHRERKSCLTIRKCGLVTFKLCPKQLISKRWGEIDYGLLRRREDGMNYLVITRDQLHFLAIDNLFRSEVTLTLPNY